VISIEAAFAHYVERLVPVGTSSVPIARALHRALAEPVSSPIELPAFPQSSMDGFALRAADTVDACSDRPVALRLVGVVAAGAAEARAPLGRGESVRILTGGRVPDGADAVVPQEDAVRDGDRLLLGTPVQRGAYVRRRGEELPRGQLLADAGQLVTPGVVGALAVAGVARVVVHDAPRVHVLATGDEVVAPGEELASGQVFDANAPLVSTWLVARGTVPAAVGHVGDDLGATGAALDAALADADLVIVAGGVSVGDRDFVRPAAAAVGIEEVFWRVRQKPGKPLAFGVRDGVALLGLPGNPGAVFVCLHTHVAAVLDRLAGLRPSGPHWRHGALAADVVPDPDRDAWLRCRLGYDETGAARLSPMPRQASHMVGELAACQAIALVRSGGAPIREGTVLPWIAVEPTAGPPGTPVLTE
jgi:molybdopterin molybdotransferase